MTDENGTPPTEKQKNALGRLEEHLQEIIDTTAHSGTERMRAALALFILEIEGADGLDAKEFELIRHLANGRKAEVRRSFWDKLVETLGRLVSGGRR